MPRSSGTSGKMKEIRKKLARKKKIPRSSVIGSLVRNRLGTQTPFKFDSIFPGIKVRVRQGETVQQAYRRAKKAGQRSGRN